MYFERTIDPLNEVRLKGRHKIAARMTYPDDDWLFVGTVDEHGYPHGKNYMKVVTKSTTLLLKYQ